MDHFELISALIPFVAALKQLQVPYYIGGSVASSVYGVARSTLDVDIVADLSPDAAGPLAELLRGTFYVDAEMIRDAVRRAATFNVIHLKTMIKIDVFVEKKDPYAKAVAGRVIRDTIDDAEPEQSFLLVSPEDIILNKLDWYRQGDFVSERQWRDVLGVIRVQAERLDRDYLRTWAERLRLTDLLDRAFSEAEK